MIAPRDSILGVLLAFAWLGTCGISTAQTLPTTEQFHGALAICATGLNVTINTDLIGSIADIYKGERSTGAASFKTATQFLELFPEADREKVYELYTKCIASILPKSTGSYDSINILRGQITQLIEFPNNQQILAPTIYQRLLINKLPQRLFEILNQYDNQQILSLGQTGSQLLQFKKDYYQFQTTAKKREDDIVTQIGQLVSQKWKFRDQWEIFFEYAVLRFDGVSQARIIESGAFPLNYEITWGDTKKVFTELTGEPQIANEMEAIRDGQLRMMDEASKAASSV